MSFHPSVFPRRDSPGFLIYRTANLLKAGLHSMFRAGGISVTPEQWSVLSSLWEDEGVHQSILAAKTAKDRHNMTRILNLLQKRGLVTRKPSSEDKRCQKIYLTPRGKVLTPELIEIVTEFLGNAMAGVSEEDLVHMKRILGRIIRNIGREELKARSTQRPPCEVERA